MKRTSSKIDSRFMICPEWQGSEEQQDEAMRMSLSPEDYYTLCPEAIHSRVPPEGAWIMIKDPPTTEFTVPCLSMWYALPDDKQTHVPGQIRHRVKILTPLGTLWLWPYEYVVVRDLQPYLDMPGDHIHIHYLGGDGGVNADRLFYLRSRGISKAEAVKMLVGEVKAQDVMFITVHPAYGELLCRRQPNESRLAVKEQWAHH